MKTIGKALANKIATIIIILLVVVIGFFTIKHFIPNLFGGTTTSQYETIVKKFSQESKLVVAGAESETTANHTFTNDNVKDWPDWAKPIVAVIVGRDVTVSIPIKTEFKLELKGITPKDVNIKNNVLTFKHPITVEVDSQQDGLIKANNSNGIIDKVVDAATSGSKAQEFLDAKAQETLAITSDNVLNNKERQNKVLNFAQKDLENLLNLGNKEHLSVKLNQNDLKFTNIDKKAS